MAIRACQIASKFECRFQVRYNVLVILDTGNDLTIECLQFGFDPFLIRLHQLDRNSVGVIGLQELRLLLLQLDPSP
ncbi:hypothetical protein OAC41_05560 [Acidimicrobiales bacterium]|nr:hypothetical protein [Acidimicrobiales bacterium]